MSSVMDEIRQDERTRSEMQNNVEHIRLIMKKMNMTTDQAMDILDIQPADRPVVAQLVNSNMYL